MDGAAEIRKKRQRERERERETRLSVILSEGLKG
jgi:hypothetical protein